jgi:Domain of unknown function (DUF4260)
MTTLALASVPARRIAHGVLTATLLAFLAFETVEHGLWGAALFGVLAPDLTLLFGGGRNLARGQLHPRAVGAYNAAHRFWGPLALMAAASADLIAPGWLVIGLAWALHVALDRTAGYGLRTPEGFQRGG